MIEQRFEPKLLRDWIGWVIQSRDHEGICSAYTTDELKLILGFIEKLVAKTET